MKPCPMQPEPTVPCLFHVAPCKGRVSVLCSFTLSTGILRCVLPEPSPGKGNPAPRGFPERFSSPLITFVLPQLQAASSSLQLCVSKCFLSHIMNQIQPPIWLKTNSEVLFFLDPSAYQSTHSQTY